MKSHNYYVYITTNPGRTVLYIGVTNDLKRRLLEHYEDCNGERKTFTGRYFCYNLIYYEHFTDINLAISRETYLKALKREKKEELISHFNPKWRFLNSLAEKEKGNLPTWTKLKTDTRPY
jgi:putative endonuclease